VDDQVKVRGYRIELGEIEAALVAHPKIQSCAVLAREDSPGDKRLVAYVVNRDGASLTANELQAFLKGLPEYMVPAQFVFLGSLPLTPNGKVDRKALPVPSYGRVSKVQDSANRRTETEKTLAAIWTELLKVEHLGLNDDFFELGAHSLLVIQAVSRIRNRLGVEVSLRILFEQPTVAALATAIDALAWAVRPAESGIDAADDVDREEVEI
jgi:acyl carrier protein